MKHPVLLALLACAVATGATAQSQPRDRAHKHDHEVARQALDRGQVLPLSRILAIAADRVPGDVIKIELEAHKDGLIYELKLLNKAGRVIEMELDAKTGRILKVEND